MDRYGVYAAIYCQQLMIFFKKQLLRSTYTIEDVNFIGMFTSSKDDISRCIYTGLNTIRKLIQKRNVTVFKQRDLVTTWHVNCKIYRVATFWNYINSHLLINVSLSVVWARVSHTKENDPNIYKKLDERSINQNFQIFICKVLATIFKLTTHSL